MYDFIFGLKDVDLTLQTNAAPADSWDCLWAALNSNGSARLNPLSGPQNHQRGHTQTLRQDRPWG